MQPLCRLLSWDSVPSSVLSRLKKLICRGGSLLVSTGGTSDPVFGARRGQACDSHHAGQHGEAG
jgi:hypothetical protein